MILEISPILEQGQMKNKQQQYVELLAFLPFQTQCRDVLPHAFSYIYNWKWKSSWEIEILVINEAEKSVDLLCGSLYEVGRSYGSLYEVGLSYAMFHNIF